MRVTWISSFWAGNGYGTASYEMAVCLDRLGVDVRTLRPARTRPEMVAELPDAARAIFDKPFALGDVALVSRALSAQGYVDAINDDPGEPTIGNADTVDSIHAAASPVAGKLLALDVDTRWPASTIAGIPSIIWTGAHSFPASGITIGADVVLGRGAANRLDLASGDSLRIVSGELQIGADVALGRGAADRLDLASGDSLRIVSGELQIGADVVLSRGAADRLDVPDALRIDSVTQILQKDTGRWNAGGLRLQAIGTDDEARLMLMPSGTSSGSIIRFYNASDPDNVGAVELKLANQVASFSALSWGTGSQPDRFVFPSDFKVAVGYSPDPIPARVSILDTAEQLRLSYDASDYTSFTVSSGGILTVAPTGDLVLDPGGNDVLPGGSIEDDLGDYNRMWRTLFAAELYVETLVAQDVLATIGGRIMVAPTTKLIADVDNVQTTIDVEHNNLANNDYALLKAAPGGVAQFEVMQVTSGPTTITGGYRYSVSRDEDGSGANSWYKGDAVANLGYAAGEGYIELTSTQTVHNHLGPNVTIYSRTATTN